VAFGIFFSTAVTLILVPTLYYIGQDIRGLFMLKRRGQAAAPAS
jgi:hypothetical protein